jgi:hypothetical protein
VQHARYFPYLVYLNYIKGHAFIQSHHPEWRPEVDIQGQHPEWRTEVD